MERTMGDMAKCLKQLIPVNIPETYTIKSMFKDISEEEDIRKGVLAFREFLYGFCDHGWKVLGIAQNELSSRKNDDILLRCDYRMLKNEDTQVDSIMKDFVYPFSVPLQEFVLKFHGHYLEWGMKCNVELGFMCTHFIYSYKGKAIWRFSTSLNNGYRMILKTKNTSKYADVIEKFPESLREKIFKGYG